jgi:hypothetical protein
MMPNVAHPPRLQRWIETHWTITQIIVAIAVTALAGLALGTGEPNTPLGAILGDNRAVLYGTIAAVAGSLLGFVLAAATIVLTVAGSARLNRITESNHYGELWSMFLAATKGLGLVTVAAMAALLFDRKDSPQPAFTYGLFLLSLVASLQIGTCIWILERVTSLMVIERGARQAAISTPTPRPPGR